jgi:hypothetical protein
LNILIRGLVSQELYEFLRHGRSGISGILKKDEKGFEREKKQMVPLVYGTDFLYGFCEAI